MSSKWHEAKFPGWIVEVIFRRKIFTSVNTFAKLMSEGMSPSEFEEAAEASLTRQTAMSFETSSFSNESTFWQCQTFACMPTLNSR